MPSLSRLRGRALKSTLLALIVLFAQQAAQLHALAHAQDELVQQTQKGRPVSHAVEHCLAFHALDSALVAVAALPDCSHARSAHASWALTDASERPLYRLPSRAPPRAA